MKCPECQADLADVRELALYCPYCGSLHQSGRRLSQMQPYDLSFRDEYESMDVRNLPAHTLVVGDWPIRAMLLRGDHLICLGRDKIMSADIGASARSDSLQVAWEMPNQGGASCLLKNFLCVVTPDKLQWYHLKDRNICGHYELRKPLPVATPDGLLLLPVEHCRNELRQSLLAVISQTQLTLLEFMNRRGTGICCEQEICETTSELGFGSAVTFASLDQDHCLSLYSASTGSVRIDLNPIFGSSGNSIRPSPAEVPDLPHGSTLEWGLTLHKRGSLEVNLVRHLSNACTLEIRHGSDLRLLDYFVSRETSEPPRPGVSHAGKPLIDSEQLKLYLPGEKNEIGVVDVEEAVCRAYAPDFADNLNLNRDELTVVLSHLCLVNGVVWGLFPIKPKAGGPKSLALCSLRFEAGRYSPSVETSFFVKEYGDGGSLSNLPLFFANGRFVSYSNEQLFVLG